jgi:hypothetical protein
MVNVTAIQSVRDAIAASNLQRALYLWQQYTAGIAAAGPTQESLAEAAELIRWAKPLISAVRTRADERLRALHVAGMYGQARPVKTRVGIRESF